MNHELPMGWVEVEIGKIASVVGGGTPKASNPDNFLEPGKGTAWLTPADLSGYKQKEIGHGKRDLSEKGLNSSSAVLMPKGALLFSSRAPIGYVAIASNEISTNQGFKSFVFTDGVYPSYAFYYLKSIKSLAEERGSGSTFKELSGAAAKKLPFILPPASEQIRIADKLDSVLARVNAAQARLDKIPALIKRFRQSVLATATSGELTREWRGSSGIGRNQSPVTIGQETSNSPEGWEWKRLQDIAELESGHTPRKSEPEYWEGGDVLWISLQDIRSAHGKVIYDTKFKPTQKGIDNSSARMLPVGTVCFSRDISVGFTTIMGERMATTQHFANWICGGEISNFYLMYSLMSAQQYLTSSGKGSTVKTIYMPALKEFYVLCPPRDEQHEIVRRVESLFALADTVEKQYQDAKAHTDRLTQSILAKAFRGELVPQDPSDEPAEQLLARIQQRLAEQAKTKPKRGRKTSTAKSKPEKIAAMKLTEAPEHYLLTLLTELGGEADAALLWKKSGLEIDDFYALLKQETTIQDDNASADPSQRKLKIRQ